MLYETIERCISPAYKLIPCRLSNSVITLYHFTPTYGLYMNTVQLLVNKCSVTLLKFDFTILCWTDFPIYTPSIWVSITTNMTLTHCFLRTIIYIVYGDVPETVDKGSNERSIYDHEILGSVSMQLLYKILFSALLFYRLPYLDNIWIVLWLQGTLTQPTCQLCCHICTYILYYTKSSRGYYQ